MAEELGTGNVGGMLRDVGEGNIRSGRLNREQLASNFGDLHPPLSAHEAAVEADRCYFCHDAPCMRACPTSIDIPLFIREIATGNPTGSAHTIFAQNILGGMCARVCPTETLCEEVCVREVAEGKPVRIGQLQRFATDHVIGAGPHPFGRASPTGRRVAVVGAGPAGLACAHRLAMHGHDVILLDIRDKPGGLNEHGIAAYKTVDDFAAREVDFVLSIGGIELRSGVALGRDVTLDELRADHDAVFLGLGLGAVGAIGMEGEDLDGVVDAVRYIESLRQADDLGALPVGRRVVVIGGGMTAIDIAIQSKLLGAEEVTIAYRRGPGQMKASVFEQELAQTRGVSIRHWLAPRRALAGPDGALAAVEFATTVEEDGRLRETGETRTFAADMLFKAIGQAFAGFGDPAYPSDLLPMQGGRIAVDDERRTGLDRVWAGGDCVAGGEDLTVTAVEDGKIAAESIHRRLTGG